MASSIASQPDSDRPPSSDPSAPGVAALSGAGVAEVLGPSAGRGAAFETRAAAPGTARIGCAPASARSDADSSVPSGSNAIASPWGSPGSGTRTGLVASAATRSSPGTRYRYASV